MTQRRVATPLNCRKWTTIIEALNTHQLIVALPMHLSNLASPTTVLLITQSMRSCQRGTRIRHTDIMGGSIPLVDPTSEAAYEDGGLQAAERVSWDKRGWHACT
jgi:hypothetical protein